MSLERVPVDLRRVCGSIVTTLQASATAKRLALSLDFADIAPDFAISDPTRLQQLLINLISNSIKFAPTGQAVTLIVEAVMHMPQGHSLPSPHSPPHPESEAPQPTDSVADARTSLLSPSAHSPDASAAERDRHLNPLLPCLDAHSMFSDLAASICLNYFSAGDEALTPDSGARSRCGSSDLSDHHTVYVQEEDPVDHLTRGPYCGFSPDSPPARACVCLKLSVLDTGVGMSPYTLTSLFTPFTQAKLSTVREHGGSGLGLSITSGIVRAMRGCIQVTSELGCGSKFSIFLHLPLSSQREWTHTKLSSPAMSSSTRRIAAPHPTGAHGLRTPLPAAPPPPAAPSPIAKHHHVLTPPHTSRQ